MVHFKRPPKSIPGYMLVDSETTTSARRRFLKISEHAKETVILTPTLRTLATSERNGRYDRQNCPSGN